METKNYNQITKSLMENLSTNMQTLRDYVASGGKNETEAIIASIQCGVLFGNARDLKIDVSGLELEMREIQKGSDNLKEI